jgi:PKD repeat protein
VDAISPVSLLVPSLKNTTQPIPDGEVPATFPLDHFKCYLVELSEGEAPFAPFEVALTDQFNGPGGKRFTVKGPTRLCIPVEKEVGGQVTEIQNPDDNLLCYGLSPVRGEPRNLPVRGIHVNNQFGPLQVDAEREKELCVPPPPRENLQVEIVTDPDPPKQCTAPLIVNFSAVVTTSGANIVSYAWDFADGGTSNESNPSHSFNGSNEPFIVTLSVTDSLGRTGSAEQAIIVCSNGPVAFFEFAQRDDGTLTVDFDASFSASPFGVTRYRWTFGDTSPPLFETTTPTTNHVYSSPGTYNVFLRITDGEGLEDDFILPVTVTGP